MAVSTYSIFFSFLYALQSFETDDSAWTVCELFLHPILPSPNAVRILNGLKLTQQFWFSVYFYYYWYHSIMLGGRGSSSERSMSVWNMEWVGRQTIAAVQCTWNQWIWQHSNERPAVVTGFTNILSPVHIQSWLILFDMHCRKSLEYV